MKDRSMYSIVNDEWTDMIADKIRIKPILLERAWDEYRNRVAESGLLDDLDDAIDNMIDIAREYNKDLA